MKERFADILEYLTFEDLSGDTKMIAEAAGMDITKLLLMHFDGISLSIQKIKNMEGLLVRYLRKKYPAEKYSKRERIKIAQEINRPPRDIPRLLSMR
ncbi:MAG: hypothetical protein KIT33_15360 [Candidatus Kapabacteria bacterium]|nr:hypothetical protein [Ignavibacteriota bacterium]MCW5886347.1 hypothetical protein [Candidatus Kapabacteria bacterium]